jgi:hypothetical protein
VCCARVDGDFLCLVSLHDAHRNKTPTEHFGKVEASSAWRPVSISALELIDHISAGKAWVGCHLGGSRSEANAGASNLIVLDIDGDLSIGAFWAKPLVQRCCLFTATSCSHNASEHRFRAVFRCDEHDNPRLHKAIYHHWLAALNLQLKDNSGEKPERLWFGNDAADIQFGAGEPISWDIIEAAKEALAAEEAKRSLPRPEPSATDTALDNERAAWVLNHLLRPSSDGEFSSYWSPVLNAAAATGSDLVRDAFFCWHGKGHHSKTQKSVEKRFDKAGTKITPGQGAGQLQKLAKDQHGSDWWRQLPEHLWFGSGGTAPLAPPQVLMRARSKSDIEPMSPSGGSIPLSSNAATGATVPDVVPTAAALEQLASRASIMRTSAKTAAAGTEPAELTLADKLRRLYMLRAHGVLQTGDDLQEVPEHQRACLDRELLGEVLAHSGYCNQPSEVERDLLALFRTEQGLRDNSYAEVKATKFTGDTHKVLRWLIPNFLIAGGEHILYSKPGVGKTTLALHMVRAVTGDPALDRFLDSDPLNNHHIWQRNPVLFIGTDMYASAEEMTAEYLKEFKLMGLEFLKQVEWWFESEDSPPWLLTLKDLTKLYRFLESNHHNGTPVAAVFIDSMKAVCPDHLLVGQQGFKDYIKLIKMMCKRFSATLVWVHHSRADGSGAQGITRITEGSDANFHLKRDDKTRQISLDIEKLRGGRGRTLYINPFKPIPLLLPNPEEIPDEDSIENNKEQMILEVLAEHFKQHRLVNLTSSAEWIEKSYPGMRPTDIEQSLKQRFRGSAAAISSRTLTRLLTTLKEKGSITGKGRYRLPPHFQLDLSDQADLELPDPTDADLPGWDA